MDENIKLRATIEGDSKPLQNALEQAGQSADQAAKQVGGKMEATSGAMDNAAGAARAMGEAGKEAAGAIADAMRRPLDAIQEVANRAREANGELQGLGQSSNQVGQTAVTAGATVSKTFTALAAKLAIVTKGLEVIKRAIYDKFIKPFHDAGKEIAAIASMHLGNAEKQEAKATKYNDMQKALLDYYEVWRKAQQSGLFEDKHNEQLARAGLETAYKIKINIDGDVQDQVAKVLQDAQKEVIKALEEQESLYNRALFRQKKAVRAHDTVETQAAYGGYLGKDKFEADRDALIEKQWEIEGKLKQIQADLAKARVSNPGAEFVHLQTARWIDEDVVATQKQLEEERKAEEAAAKAAEDRAKALAKATEALDQWASDLLDDEGQKKLNAAFEKYAGLIEQGVSEADAKPILEEAVRQELNNIVEKEAAAREELVKEYISARDALKGAMKREQDAQEALAKANESLADLKKQQAKEDRLEKIDQKRSRLQSKMSRFGFKLEDGSHIGESAAARRKRQRTERTDARIAAKLRRAESGRSVYFNDEEKRRLKQYKALQKQDKALDKEAKAIRAADKQLTASSALKSASDAIKTAAENLEAATAERETAQAEALEKRWNAEEAIEKEAAARKRAEEGVKSRGQKWSEKPTKEIPKKQTPAQTAAPTKPAAKKQTPIQTAAPTKPIPVKQTPAQTKRAEGPKQSRPMVPQTKRAAAGVKQQVKMTAPSRGGIAGKAAKPKDYSGYLDKITRDLGEKIYVVK